MKSKFTSKEIDFLKAKNEQFKTDFSITAPDDYFSDLIKEKTGPIEHFEKRLLQSEQMSSRFVTAVLKAAGNNRKGSAIQPVSSKMDPHKKIDPGHIFEETFNLVFDKKRGIWEKLDEAVFAIAVADKNNRASELVLSLKDKISRSLSSDILVGVAKFPFHDFTPTQCFENALKALDHAAFFGPDTLLHFDSTSINIHADRLYQSKDYEAAIREYQSGLGIEPDNVNLLNSLGVCYGVKGELDRAMVEFEKALKVKPKELMAIYNTGLLYRIRQDVDNALKYLQKAHLINDSIFEVELLLGSLMLKRKQKKAAVTHLESAARINPDSWTAHKMLGEIYLKEKSFEKAGRHFNRAIKTNPHDAACLSGYAKSLELQDKNMSIALSFAEKSVSLKPENKLFQERLKAIQAKIDGSRDEKKDLPERKTA